MIQAENIVITPEIPEDITASDFWSSLKGLGFEDMMSQLMSGLINFALKLALAILIFYVGRFIIRKIYGVVYNLMVKRHVDLSLTTFVLSLIKITLYFILIITIIGILGLETSSFLALFASAGVAVGMALSGTLQNFAGGVLILLLKPYKVGDYIEVQGYTGTVKSIQLFHTIINTVDNKAIILPNGALSTGSINNYSLENYRRVDWSVGLCYGTDLARAKEEIMQILLSDERVIKQFSEEENESEINLAKKHSQNLEVTIPKKVERKPFVGLNSMDDSAIVLTVRAWTKASNYWGLYFDMNERLYTELPKLGFEFPFPQMDVHLDGKLESFIGK